MSSLLERMIQRARTPLGGIEPLVESRYAHANGQFQMDSFMEPNETSHAGFMSSSNPAGALAALPAPPAARTPDQHVPESPASADQGFKVRPARTTDPDAVHPGPGKPRAGRLETQLSGAGAATPQPRIEAVSASRAAPSPPIAAVLADAGKPATERIVATSRAQAVPVTMRPPVGKALSPPPPQQPAPGREAEPEKEGAKVTISIGHIEVRAAQAAERPRRPAFRPRVSLDDFLSRQNGARS